MVSHGNPYVISSVPQDRTYAMAFGTGATMENASALAIAGQRAISGHSPISLPASTHAATACRALSRSRAKRSPLS